MNYVTVEKSTKSFKIDSTHNGKLSVDTRRMRGINMV